MIYPHPPTLRFSPAPISGLKPKGWSNFLPGSGWLVGWLLGNLFFWGGVLFFFVSFCFSFFWGWVGLGECWLLDVVCFFVVCCLLVVFFWGGGRKNWRGGKGEGTPEFWAMAFKVIQPKKRRGRNQRCWVFEVGGICLFKGDGHNFSNSTNWSTLYSPSKCNSHSSPTRILQMSLQYKRNYPILSYLLGYIYVNLASLVFPHILAEFCFVHAGRCSFLVAPKHPVRVNIWIL